MLASFFSGGRAPRYSEAFYSIVNKRLELILFPLSVKRTRRVKTHKKI
jgi:hypothetical protein